MRFRWSVSILVLLLSAFVWASFHQPGAAYCGMYLLTPVAAVLLVLSARKPKTLENGSVPLALRRSHRTRTLLLVCLLLSIGGWSALMGWEAGLPSRVERALALIAPALSVMTLLVLLRWLKLRERIPEPDVPRCTNCGYSLRGLTSKRCPECGQEFTS